MLKALLLRATAYVKLRDVPIKHDIIMVAETPTPTESAINIMEWMDDTNDEVVPGDAVVYQGPTEAIKATITNSNRYMSKTCIFRWVIDGEFGAWEFDKEDFDVVWRTVQFFFECDRRLDKIDTG